jgi:hypothetical protein
MLTLKQAQQALANREAFNAGNLTASIEDNDTYDVAYVVRSYGVAIADCPAFIDNPGVYPNAYNHSQTTSKHANMVKRAWSLT